MRYAWIFLIGLALPGGISAAAGTQKIYGMPSADQVRACGVTIEFGADLSIVPFLDADQKLAGHYRLTVTKRSLAGTSTSMQVNVFSNGRLGVSRVRIDRPATVEMMLQIESSGGAVLCHLASTIETGAAPSV